MVAQDSELHTMADAAVTLRPDSPLPLYHQLQEALLEEIRLGNKKPGDILPTEAQLAKRYGVSRATARQALRALSDKGLIERRQGVGTFVGPGKIIELLPGLVSFSQEMRARGYGVTSSVLSVEKVPAPHDVARELAQPSGTRVLRVIRLRHIDNQPIVLSTSYLLPAVSPDDDFTQSIYELLERSYGVSVVAGRTRIEAVGASPEDAALLLIRPGFPCLSIRWIGVSSHGNPVEYSSALYRGDRYSYEVELQRRTYWASKTGETP